MKVVQFPLVRITLFFVLGILVAKITKPELQVVTPLLFIAIGIIFLSYFLSKKTPILRFIFGISVFATSFLIGTFSWVSSIQTHNSSHYLHQLSGSENTFSAEVIIAEKLKSTSTSDRYTAAISQWNGKHSYGKILVNFKKDGVFTSFENGVLLHITGMVYRNKRPKNPDQFDYSAYLENQQIYAQAYTDYASVKKHSTPKKTVFYFASKLRNRIIQNLAEHHFNATELSVVAALILGQQQDISKEIVRDYQYAGAVHILSVSGLHVGFVLLFITLLLQPISNTRRNSFIKLCIVLAALWSFGILAGLAPSVVRSVTMFSFVAIGMFLRRSVNIYHTLFVSALLILLFEPSFLFDVGFQLSYLALFFIVWLQPVLSSIWKPKNKIGTYFWDIVTVSFAAQIGTFPLSLYYFHQFPGLFFVTNIIILPMLSIIMGIGLVVMILAALNWSWMPLLKILEYSIWLLNTIIRWVASFEDFIFKDISFNGLMMISCYVLLFSSILWILHPTHKKLYMALIAIVLLQASSIYTKYSNQKVSEFIVFNKKKSTIITERIGEKITLYSTDSVLKNYKKEGILKSYAVANYCTIVKQKRLSNLYFFKDKRIVVIDSSSIYLPDEKADILLLISSPKVNLERLFISYKPKQVVADGSNFKSYVKLWKASCMKEKIPFHDTSEKGFYKI